WLTGSLAAQLSTFSLVSLVGSNVFSNVPFVMLAAKWVPAFENPKLMWYALALSSTLAGNLTLVGSIANLIVAEAARERCPITFRAYLAAGVPVTLVTTTAGMAMLFGAASAGLLR
ncbi:MAG: anion transporter, partial [Myxococcales bacterium]